MHDLSPLLTAPIPYLTAFLAGLFGGVHCAGMCGGVVGALVYGVAQTQRHHVWRYLIHYNLGRITTYTALGVVAGSLGSQAADFAAQYHGWLVLRVLAGALMMVMGLYLAGWWLGLTKLERLGGHVIWRHMQPLSRRLLPIKSPAHAYPFGLLWGLLPCGLVYTMLIWSLAAGGWWQGAALFLAFGLGTLPTLLAMGYLAHRYGPGYGRANPFGPSWRKTAGAIVIVFGAWTIFASLAGHAHAG